ncbi:hypothetical protein [Ferroplasma acidarmanus]|jgi:hypothetical protein|uniref:Uncharacterized protein n=1 Tax=Ferroplasma acidarmanus Fer1 TaxID=333146 RepID=S0AKZ7_FERAC|nr:hypothetical protein [Ferroplasma acidarmanus]AGO60038.1 hypothetical protein FACI_IFERC00001G0058 [Ferroplasma acidarmanus Fer1]
MYDPERIKVNVKEKREKNKTIAVKLFISAILIYIVMFSVEAITSKNLIIHYALIPILIGFSIVIITSVKLINKINIKLNKKIENHAKTKLIEGFVLLSIIISFSVYYLLSKNSITLYILVALLLICSIIISKMMNIFYKLLNSGIISINTNFNKNIKYSTLVDIGGILLILSIANIIILLISEMSGFLNLFSITIIAIFSAIIVLLAFYMYKSYNYKLFKIN